MRNLGWTYYFSFPKISVFCSAIHLAFMVTVQIISSHYQTSPNWAEVAEPPFLIENKIRTNKQSSTMRFSASINPFTNKKWYIYAHSNRGTRCVVLLSFVTIFGVCVCNHTSFNKLTVFHSTLSVMDNHIKCLFSFSSKPSIMLISILTILIFLYLWGVL